MKTKRLICIFIAAVMILTVSAAAKELVPGGRALGIRMTTDGVMVAELTSIVTDAGEFSPAKDAGIMKGDIIKKLGAGTVCSAEDLASALSKLDGKTVAVTVERAGKLRQFNVTPGVSDGRPLLGLMLRDCVCGVGTLTFYDPETGIYGALGHSISDADSGAVLPLSGGSIYNAGIVGIDKGKAGAPGALNGHSDELYALGDIRINCGCGIFGEAELEGKTVETGIMHEGEAHILCTLHGKEVHEYGIEVRKVTTGELTTAVICVTDPELIELTGGIVQGMSGSPIIQDGKLVGAVTHVFVNDPTSGYGISIQDMLAAAEKCDKAA